MTMRVTWVFALQTLFLMCCGWIRVIQALDAMACARETLGMEGPREFYLDSTSGKCVPGSGGRLASGHGKAYKVHTVHKNKGCVRWRHLVSVTKGDTEQKKNASRDLLKNAVRLGKQLRVAAQNNGKFGLLITMDMAYIYGEFVCAGAFHTLGDTVFVVVQYMFCSDGYSQFVGTPIFLSNPWPSLQIEDFTFTEMMWFVRESVCYHLGFEHDTSGSRITGSRDKMVDGIRHSGYSIVLHQEVPYLSTIETIVFPNTLAFTRHAVSAYTGNEFAVEIPFGDVQRIIYPTQKSTRLIKEHSDTGNRTQYKCNINGPNANCKRQIDHIGTKWFVENKWVKAHNMKNGHSDIKTLADAVRRGKRVRASLGGWSSEPALVTLEGNNRLHAVFIDNFHMAENTDPTNGYLQWRILSTDGMSLNWNINYDTWTLLPQSNVANNFTDHVIWYFENANWKALFNSLEQQEYHRMENAMMNGCEIRVRWYKDGIDAMYDIDVLYDIDALTQDDGAGPKQVLPHLDLSTFPLSYSSHATMLEMEVIRFDWNGQVTRSVWKTGHQSRTTTTYDAQNLTWFALDGLDEF